MTSKRYLTGIDWLIHTFDHMNKQKIGRGNVFHVIFEVNSLLNVELFTRELNEFINKCDVFKGSVSRSFNLAPYWKINKNKKIEPVIISSSTIQESSELIVFFTKIFEKHDQSNDAYLYCDVVFHNEESYVSFTFSHKVFDGIGAELFVDAFEKYMEDKNSYVFENKYFEPSHLNGWIEKFKSGKQVNQKLIRLSPGRNVRVLPLGEIRDEYKFKIIQFDEEETSKIIERANKEAGYLLVMPFLLSKTVSVFNKLLNKKGIRNDNMVVPVTVNARKKGVFNKIFFNHLSFMFFSFNSKEAESPIASIKNQLYEQTKSRFADKFCNNAMLMRIFPAPILSKLLGLYSKGKMATFSFSYLGEAVNSERKLFSKAVQNVYHMPCPSVPPGIGVIINNCNGKFNLTISYLNALLDEKDAEYLVNELNEMPNE